MEKNSVELVFSCEFGFNEYKTDGWNGQSVLKHFFSFSDEIWLKWNAKTDEENETIIKAKTHKYKQIAKLITESCAQVHSNKRNISSRRPSIELALPKCALFSLMFTFIVLSFVGTMPIYGFAP